MTGFQNIKQQLLPLIKGLPIIILIFTASLFIAGKIISYSPNVYQTIAKIKLDDQRQGVSNSKFYRDLEVFNTENIVESEAEILKSPLIISKMIDSSDFNILLYRKGKLKNTMLYDDAPFHIEYQFENEALYDRNFILNIVTDSGYTLIYDSPDQQKILCGKFNEVLKINGGEITILKNKIIIQDRGISLEGEYQFKVFSRNGLIAHISKHLDVKVVDKDIAVLRAVYKAEHPQKVADIVNALCKAYVDDYMMFKSNSANKTVQFIDKKLAEVSLQLQQAEKELETFKINNKVVNTLQETETGLREISKLNVQLINLEMNESAINELQTYINGGDYFDETAINFGFGDLLMTELVKKLKLWQDERHDLLIKYQPDNDNVQAIDAKIAEVKGYIKEAIKQNLKEIRVKRQDIEAEVEKASHRFDNLPTREKSQHILEREFRLLEDVYNFLSQKKIEASITSTAMLSFHRIIQPAIVPVEPVSPNKTLITFVAGLLGLILGIAFIYSRKYLNAKVVTRGDIEKHSLLPFAGVIRKGQTSDDFRILLKGMMVKGVMKPNQVIAVTSTLNKEGKSYLARHTALNLLEMGYTVCLLSISSPLENGQALSKFLTGQAIDFNLLTEINYVGQKSLSNKDLDQLKLKFDFVIIDSTATAIDISGVEAIKSADLTLYVVRANYTAIHYVAHPDLLKEEYDLNHIYTVLNDAHLAMCYNGNYVGSRFNQNRKPKDFFKQLSYYFTTYISK